MNDIDEFDNFIINGDFTDETISSICETLSLNKKQLITKTFRYLKSLISYMDKGKPDPKILYKINTSIVLISVACKNEKFSDEEIEHNRDRIRKRRESLLEYYNIYRLDILLTSSNMLDEVILNKAIDVNDLILLIKSLIDRKETINIIKTLLKYNKEVLIINNNELFDYSFDKAIEAIHENSPDIYYYITLLKILYSTTIDKNKYLRRIYENSETCDKNEFANEKYMNVHGEKRALNTEQILKKYCISDNLDAFKIPKFERELTSEYAISIDDYKTIIREDAISIKKDGNNYIVGIHISDPGKYIYQDSFIDKQAKNNFKCVYLPDTKLRILNQKLEHGFSLDKNMKRNVISMYVVLDKESKILDFYLKEEAIIVKDNLDFIQADNLINVKRNNELYKMLCNLYSLTYGLKEKNKKKAEYWKKKNKNKDIYLENNKGYIIVSELMVLYNYLIAGKMCEESIPYVYRTQDYPYIEKLVKKLDIDIDEQTKRLIKSMYLPSRYSYIPMYHNGLNLPYYSHSADGVRRYPDLYNQFLLHYFYFNDIEFNFDYDEFVNLIEYFNQRNVEITLMNSEYLRAYKLVKKG